MDGDGDLEILVSALAAGPLHAWHHDGTPVAGWPISGISGVGYAAMGNLVGNPNGLEVFSGHWGTPGKMCAYDGGGAFLPGWPFTSGGWVTTPGALMDINGDGMEEIFVGEEDADLNGYDASGGPLAGWPAHQAGGGQERHTPSFVDLDGDGDIEILTASGKTTPGVYLYAYHHDGTGATGFPYLANGFADTFLAAGDVDADLRPEIVAVMRQSASPWKPILTILSGNGTVERSLLCAGTFSYGTAPALADLDGDAFPEILIQTDSTLEVYKGDGTALPGWPVSWTGRMLGNSSPVVGDVDGDQLPDIVITTKQTGTVGEVRAFNSSGTPLTGFPLTLNLGSGAVPAIADLDLDGRNEIIITGDYWSGYAGTYDKVWVYDLGGTNHGPIQWGQFGGNSRHNGRFMSSVTLYVSGTTLSWTTANAANGYDLIRGDLNVLQASSGDFSLATVECLSNDQPERTYDFADVPDPEKGYWFLVRAATPLGHGTYDSEGLFQAAGRDAGIAASGFSCP